MERVVAQQVSRALVQQSASGDRMLVVRLTPPELGTVRVEIVEHQGTLSARLHSDDDGVRTALERALPGMRQELRASDAPIRELSMGNQSLADQPFSHDQGQHQQHRSGNGPAKSGDDPVFSVDGSQPIPSTLPAARRLGAQINGNGVDALA
jgi:flagellar hook-length control protein FliK